MLQKQAQRSKFLSLPYHQTTKTVKGKVTIYVEIFCISLDNINDLKRSKESPIRSWSTSMSRGSDLTSSTTTAIVSRFLNNLISQSGMSGISDWLKDKLR